MLTYKKALRNYKEKHFSDSLKGSPKLLLVQLQWKPSEKHQWRLILHQFESWYLHLSAQAPWISQAHPISVLDSYYHFKKRQKHSGQPSEMGCSAPSLLWTRNCNIWFLIWELLQYLTWNHNTVTLPNLSGVYKVNHNSTEMELQSLNSRRGASRPRGKELLCSKWSFLLS